MKLEEHLRFIAYSFNEMIPDDDQEQLIANRAEALNKFHNGEMDCRIVAEAEVGDVLTLVSLDATLISRLSPHTNVCLRRPTELWTELALPPGAPPKWVPGNGHPLEHETWWRWQQCLQNIHDGHRCVATNLAPPQDRRRLRPPAPGRGYRAAAPRCRSVSLDDWADTMTFDQEVKLWMVVLTWVTGLVRSWP